MELQLLKLLDCVNNAFKIVKFAQIHRFALVAIIILIFIKTLNVYPIVLSNFMETR